MAMITHLALHGIKTYESFDSAVLILTGLGVVLLDLRLQSRIVGSLQHIDPSQGKHLMITMKRQNPNAQNQEST